MAITWETKRRGLANSAECHLLQDVSKPSRPAIFRQSHACCHARLRARGHPESQSAVLEGPTLPPLLVLLRRWQPRLPGTAPQALQPQQPWQLVRKPQRREGKGGPVRCAAAPCVVMTHYLRCDAETGLRKT